MATEKSEFHVEFSAEQFQKMILQQQKQMEKQLKLIEALTQRLNLKPSETVSHESPSSSIDSLANSITEFCYNPESGLTFDTWFKRWEDMFQTDFRCQDDSWKVRLLMRKLGTNEHSRFIDHILPRQPKDLTFDEAVSQLSETFGELASLFSIRYECLKITKRDAEDYGMLADRVNRECERFKLNSLSIDQFKCLVFIKALQSPEDAEIRTRLLAKLDHDADTSLQTLMAECKRLLSLRHDTAIVEQRPVPADVKPVQSTSHRKPSNTSKRSSSKKPPTACWSCGEWHYARFCPFKKHICQKCKKRGHNEECCKTTRSGQNKQERKLDKRHSESRSVVAAFRSEAPSKRKYVTVHVNGKPIRLQFDSASDITLISSRIWKQIGSPQLIKSDKSARNASGGELKLIGELECDITFDGVHKKGTCYVTEHPNLNLFGIDWIEMFGLFDVPINEFCHQVHLSKTLPSSTASMIQMLKRTYAKVFHPGLGHCTKFKATLRLKPGVCPVFRPKRPVPYAAIQAVDDELERLQQLGVIQPTNYSSWAAPIVVVKKANGNIRICADYSTGLNSSLEDHQYPLPVPEDIFTKLNGGTCFAKIDLSDAYLQIPVSDDCQELLTINTHRGLFRYTRLPFGVKSAPAIFQQLMDTMLTGITGATAYLDDIIIVGKTEQELFAHLKDTLARIQEYGLRIREDKCNFFIPSIKYLGFIFDKDGRKPDPENVAAIQNMPPPKDLPTLRSFLGLVSHYSVFLPDMHRVRAPMNHLLTKDQPWNWSEQCQKAFEAIKAMLTSDLLLTYFNPELEIVLAADASNTGVGAVISHRFPDGSEKAIAHAARTLTSTEQKYSQIEKEALAIIFAVKKFHKMLYGHKFTMLTDHKPLLAIFASKKGIPVYTANRLQRWALTLLSYDFQIRYQRTSSFGQADALSRLIATKRQQPEDTVIAAVSVENDVKFVLSDALRNLPVTAADVCKATKEDPTLAMVIRFLGTGWPKTLESDEVRQLYQRKDSLSIVNGCLMFADRVVIPKVLQARVLRQFHHGHPGINRMKALARSYVYWPFMDSHLEQLVRSCFKCASALKMPVKSKLSSWSTPQKPWSRLHIDYAGPINGQSFLVLVDAYSKWPEVSIMANTNTAATITKLREIFGRFGVPETIISDNGTQFTSKVFADFCNQNGIDHIRSPPYHPQSNGQAERFVDTLKRALQKSKGEGTTAEIIESFLFLYRATPNPQTPNGVSPAEALFNRRLRMPFDVIRPSTASTERNHAMEDQYNRRHGARQRTFSIGQPVLARDYRHHQTQWTAGTILKRHGNVLYEVQVGPDIWTRHANQLRPTRCSTQSDSTHRLPIDILLDTFELRPQSQTYETPSFTCGTLPLQAHDETPTKSLLPRRWTDRRRTRTKRLQVNPRKSSYAEPGDSKGEVLG